MHQFELRPSTVQQPAPVLTLALVRVMPAQVLEPMARAPAVQVRDSEAQAQG